MVVAIKLTGKVLGAYLGQDPHSLVTTRQPQVKVTLEGFEGDKHAGITRPSDGRTPHYPRGTEIRNDRQVAIVSIEELDQVAREMGLPQILPEWLGANLLLGDIPKLTRLPPSTRLFFSQGAVLVVEHENLPCSGPGRVIQNQYARNDLESLFPHAALHRRGLVACVEKTGIICEGDAVRVEIPEQVIYTV
jgi:MOSC domain-containing protein YiiM